MSPELLPFAQRARLMTRDKDMLVVPVVAAILAQCILAPGVAVHDDAMLAEIARRDASEIVALASLTSTDWESAPALAHAKVLRFVEEHAVHLNPWIPGGFPAFALDLPSAGAAVSADDLEARYQEWCTSAPRGMIEPVLVAIEAARRIVYDGTLYKGVALLHPACRRLRLALVTPVVAHVGVGWQAALIWSYAAWMPSEVARLALNFASTCDTLLDTLKVFTEWGRGVVAERDAARVVNEAELEQIAEARATMLATAREAQAEHRAVIAEKHATIAAAEIGAMRNERALLLHKLARANTRIESLEQARDAAVASQCATRAGSSSAARGRTNVAPGGAAASHVLRAGQGTRGHHAA